MTVVCILFLFFPALLLPAYQFFLETKGINDPTLSISLYKTTIILDSALKLFLILPTYDFDTYVLICMSVDLGFYMFFVASLSLKVPKTSLRHNRKYPQETNYTLCAFKVIVWGMLSVVLDLIILTLWTFEDEFSIYMMCFIMITMVVLWIMLSARALMRLDRLKYPSIRSLNGLSNGNSPIVLLRSFKIDANPTMNGKVFDETICENLNLEKNPIISLANPDEILPSGGSLKIQAKDSEWKEVVKEVLKSCRAVVLVEGLSDGLHWEISTLKEFLKPQQLFVMIPSYKFRELAWCYDENAGSGVFSIMRNIYRFMPMSIYGGRKRKNNVLDTIWMDFSSKMNQFGFYTPDVFPGNNVLLKFDDNWNAIKVHEVVDNTHSMLDYIVKQTIAFNMSDFDYSMLAKKVESFEVNGFLNKEDIVPFKRLIYKCNKAGRIVALICFVFFIAVVIFMIYG